MAEFVILDYPFLFALKRARKGKYGFYDASKEDKELVKKYYFSRNKLKETMDGNIAAIIFFIKKRPKNKTNEIFCNVKPDIDNCAKFVLDVAEKELNLIENDSRIAFIQCFKIWGKNDRTYCLFTKFTDDIKIHYNNNCLEFNNIIIRHNFNNG